MTSSIKSSKSFKYNKKSQYHDDTLVELEKEICNFEELEDESNDESDLTDNEEEKDSESEDDNYQEQKLDDDAEELEKNEETEKDVDDDASDNEGLEFEDKKKTIAKRKNKLKLFAFIKKIQPRTINPIIKPYLTIEYRDAGIKLLENIPSVKEKESLTYEKAIYNYCIRAVNKCKELNFRELYTTKLRHTVGILLSGTIKKSVLLTEIRNDIQEWNSEIFRTIISADQINIKKLMTPLVVEESDEFVCKCGNKKIFKVTLQLRSSDEPPSFILKCNDNKCPHTWRVG